MLRLLTAGFGTKRRIDAAQLLGRYRSEADMRGCRAPTGPGAHDPEQKSGQPALRLLGPDLSQM